MALSIYAAPAAGGEGTARARNWRAFAATLAFFLVQMLLLRNHEIWSDEMQAWLLARDSGGIGALFANLRYEGHPALWHLLLMPLTRIFADPAAMQVLHVAIASGSAFLVCRYSPFTWPVRLLLVTGYFLFFEYAQISRSYGLGVMLLFAACSLFVFRRERPLALAATILLLSHTSIVALIPGAALSVALLVEWVMRQRAMGGLRAPRWDEWLAVALIVFGIGTALIQMQLAPDAQVPYVWHLELDAKRTFIALRALIGTYIPAPVPEVEFWNMPAVLSEPDAALAGLAAVLAIVPYLASQLRDRPAAFALFVLSSLVLLFFFYAKFPGAPRHHGFLFATLIASLWIAPFCSPAGNPGAAPLDLKAGRAGPSAVVILILAVHTVSAGMAAALDYRYKFSGAREAAQAIASRAARDDIVLGHPELMVMPLAAYLPQPIFYLKSGRYGSFVRWDRQRFEERMRGCPHPARRCGWREARIPAQFLAELEKGRKIFLVTNRKVRVVPEGLTVREIHHSPPVIVIPNHRLVVYEISK